MKTTFLIEYTHMLKKYWWALPVVLVAITIPLVLLGSRKQVTIMLDGEPLIVTTSAITVGNALHAAGITYHPEDSIQPAPSTLLKPTMEIHIDTARPVHIVIQPGNTWLHLYSSERYVGALLKQAGLLLQPSDSVYFNGLALNPEEQLPLAAVYVLQFRLAQTISMNQTDFQSSAFTLAHALEENGVILRSADRPSIPSTTPINGPQTVFINTARSLSIEYIDQTITGFSTAATVGQALAEAGISLQDLDYSVPEETSPLPENGVIRIVAVRDDIRLNQIASPYGTDAVNDANTELDTTTLLSAGQYGLSVSRTHVRYEDGKEVSRLQEPAVEISRPVNETIGYGTKVVIHTLQTPSGSIEYWRAVNVYVTSYSPCNSGADRCYTGTSAGLPVKEGIVAVTLKWYKLFKLQQIYVPGYGVGTIADVGGGVSGTYWIDVAYSDENYVPWDSYVTIYFLTPVPANIPLILP
jgi:uncharacterized protein YabE (DUF348 family)